MLLAARLELALDIGVVKRRNGLPAHVPVLVRSHPMALAQCQRFFRTHPWIAPVHACDTAGAIAGVVALGSIEEGAIGSRRAAVNHGATIVATELEDDPANFTRFVLITAR